jgi:hypothetical protein
LICERIGDVTSFGLGVYYYLFGCADRKIVFLYEHLGHTPFDSMTTGRYWMAGFLLSGLLTLLYLPASLILRLIIKSDKISWKPIVLFSMIPLMIGIVFIIMNLGEPKLTFIIAISSFLALIIGISIGFSVIDDLIKDYKSRFTYLLFGLGLVPFLSLFRSLELPEKGILTMQISVLVIVISIVFGFFWLLIAYRIFKRCRPKWINEIKGTLLIGYIGLPVLHFLIATPKGIPYITTSDNFFADNMIIRLSNWILLFLMVFSVDKLTKRKKPVG